VNAQTLGKLGEKHILDLLLSAGVDAQPGGPGDIILASGLALEVKAARLTQRTSGHSRRWQFCLYRQGKTDYRRSDLVVLLAYRDVGRDPEVFVIPAGRLNGNKTLKLSENPNLSKWAAFRGWDRCLDELEVTR